MTDQTTRVTRPAGAGASLVERLADDMAARWAAGDRPPAEEYLARFPALRAEPGAALELLAEELALRQEHGLPVSGDELAARFPEWSAQVRALARCQHALGAPGPRFPEVGEAVGEFRIRFELGRGAHGRVYLAAQGSLGARPVVLKLSPPRGAEHLSLARLQHTHIVPVYSVHEFADRGLRGLCMPHFGGEALDRAPAPAGEAAVCRLGAALADALHYAHARGLLHLDVKPSNVLVAADGTPMLLDFHLARGPMRAGDPPPESMGGTPGYMPPEQRAAAEAVRRGAAIPADVDARADVYALGLVLRERLGAGGGSVGLADVLTRCTAADPRDRYPTAAALAADLRRHLSDQPLRGVPNRSAAERWRKWRRRRPLALPLLLAAGAAAALALGAAARLDGQAAGARAALERGEGQLHAGRYRTAGETLRGGEALLAGHPFQADLRRRLGEARESADGGRAAEELHAVCELARPLFDSDPAAGAPAAVAGGCRRLWAGRAALVRALDHLPPEPAARGRDDLLDLALLSARFEAAEGTEAGRAAALATLDEAEALLGPAAALDLERARNLRGAGEAARADACDRRATTRPARSAWEHVLVGRAALAAGAVARAAGEMDAALALAPACFWAHYHRGACRLRVGDAAGALADFASCVALAPDRAWCAYNRGLAYAALGRPDRARDDFDRAVALDPALGPAYLARAAAHHRSGQAADALADLDRAAGAGVHRGAIDYQRAVILAPSDRPAAVVCLRSCLAADPGHRPAQELLARLSGGGPGSK